MGGRIAADQVPISLIALRFASRAGEEGWQEGGMTMDRERVAGIRSGANNEVAGLTGGGESAHLEHRWLRMASA